MTGDTYTFTTPRTGFRLVLPVIFWSIVLVICWLIFRFDPDAHDLLGINGFYVGAAFWTILCGGWFLNALVPPQLVVDRTGITWTRLGLLRRSIPWTELSEISTSAEPCSRENCPCLTYHLNVRSNTTEIHIESGLVVEEEDLRSIVETIRSASRNLGIQIEVADPDGWLVLRAEAG